MRGLPNAAVQWERGTLRQPANEKPASWRLSQSERHVGGTKGIRGDTCLPNFLCEIKASGIFTFDVVVHFPGKCQNFVFCTEKNMTFILMFYLKYLRH